MMRYLTDEEEKWLAERDGRCVDIEKRKEVGTDCKFCFGIRFRDLDEYNFVLVVAVMNEFHNGSLQCWMEQDRKRASGTIEADTLEDAVMLTFKAFVRATMEGKKYELY